MEQTEKIKSPYSIGEKNTASDGLKKVHERGTSFQSRSASMERQVADSKKENEMGASSEG